jgi:hypothetical protein
LSICITSCKYLPWFSWLICFTKSTAEITAILWGTKDLFRLSLSPHVHAVFCDNLQVNYSGFFFGETSTKHVRNGINRCCNGETQIP